MEENFILVGRISSAHGIKGALNVYSFAENTGIFSPGSSLYIKSKATGKFTLFETLSSNKKNNNILLVKLKGIKDRNHALAFKGSDIYIDRSGLPETEEGAWYWHDLIGMIVIDEDGSQIGEIFDIMRTGANDLLEVKTPEKEILIPFLKEIILSVSLEDKLVRVKLPEGLMEL
ncbi:MAG: 16S rRNA processing protein RimM [Deltaproteobacteria bacterium]|nr:MAG: 16S rRNA processing protein RimM [Deltaproteobacteria bacterium]